MNYKISQQALDDIEDIWLYTYRHWSREQADRYYNLIINEIEFVVNNFETGQDFSQFRKGYRYSKVKSHLIFYRKSVTGEAIEIIRILHERMDIQNRLME